MKAFLAVREFVPDQCIVMVTKHGVIKKCELTEFDNPMARGIIAVALDEGDELIAARLTNGTALHLPGLARRPGDPVRGEDVRPMGRPARGVRGMDLAEGDYLVGMEVVEKRRSYSLDLGTWVRQADAAPRIPAHEPRRQGRH